MDSVIIIIIALLFIFCFYVAYIFHQSLKTKPQPTKKEDVVIASRQQMLPVILQANERITLMLERISPQSLIFRINDPSLSFKALHQLMLSDIRQEFDHNVAQQIYFPDRTWKHVVLAKEEIVSLINAVASKLSEEVDTTVFLTKVLHQLNENGLPNVDMAKQLIKEDVKNLYQPYEN